MSTDLEIQAFFARGDRWSDIADLTEFARAEEQRGHTRDAADLYGWIMALIKELELPDSDLIDLRCEAKEALSRLAMI